MSTKPVFSFLKNLFPSSPSESLKKNNHSDSVKTEQKVRTETEPRFFRQCDDPYVNLPTNNTHSYSVITKESESSSKNENISKFETKTFFRKCDPDDSDYQNIEQVQIEEPTYSKYNTTAEQPKTLSAEEAKKLLRSLNEKDPPFDSPLLAKYDNRRDRYRNVLPLKDTMMTVDIGHAKADYHGARFIDPFCHRQYILMQGPLEETLGFTQAAMEQNKVQQIVCLTKGGKNQCYPYWENWDSKAIEGFTIRTPDSDEVEDWGELEMFHFERWPDQGVPKDIKEFIRFIELQRRERKEGTTAVHCSAGIGRTGVYMVATLMMDQIEKGVTTLNPLDLIAQLRRVRPGMVQTKEQLMFCFEIANVLLSKKL